MKTNPRIALLKAGYDVPGGLEKYAIQLGQALHERGCHVSLLTTTRNGKLPPGLEDQPFDVIPVCTRSRHIRAHLLNFDQACQEYLKNHPHDRVISLGRTTSQSHLYLGNGLHATYLRYRGEGESIWSRVYRRFSARHRLMLDLEKKALCNPNLHSVVVPSQMVKDDILREYPISQEKIVPIHQEIPWKALQEPFDRWEEIKPKGCHHFIFIGNFFRHKGLPLLLKSLASLPRDAWELTVVGGEKKPAPFEALAKELGLEKNITFVGYQSDVIPYLQRADTLVLPSLYDTFAYVVAEALAMGVRVIVSSRTGGKEAIAPGAGTTVSSYHPGAWTAALQEALLNPKTPASARSIRQTVRHLEASEVFDRTVATLMGET